MYKAYKEQIDKYVEENKEQFLQNLSDLIAIKSDSEDLPEVKKALHFTLDLAREFGLESEAVLNDQIGIVRYGEGDETLGVLVHIDVVPGGDKDQWTFAPYEMGIKDGLIYGRGVVDDKGPTLNCLYALKYLKDLGIKTNKKIELIIGTQEELEWTDIEEYKKTFPLPDYSFTPDGNYPIGNREKGYVDVDIMIKKTPHTKGEYEVVYFKAGTVANSVPEISTVHIKGDYNKLKAAFDSYDNEKLEITNAGDYITLTTKGVGAHSSMPELGDNSLWILAKFLKDIDICDNGFDRVVAYIANEFADDNDGKPLGLDRGIVYINGESMDKTVVCLSTGGMEDDVFHLNYNIRQVFGVTEDDISEGFKRLSEKYDATFAIFDFMDAFYTDSSRPFIQKMSKVFTENTPFESEFRLGHGTTYAKALTNSVYFGPCLPDEVDSSHQADESTTVDYLFLNQKLMTYYIVDVAISEEPLK